MLSVIPYALIFTLLVLLFYLELKKWKVRHLIRNFGSLKEQPIIGIGGRFIGKDNEGVMNIINQLFYEVKTPCHGWLGPELLIGIDDPDNIQIVLNDDKCLNKPYMYDGLWNKTGLFTSKDSEWKWHRRMLNPTFNPKILMTFLPTINEKAQTLIKQLKSYENHEIDLYRPLFKCFTDILVNTAFDTKMELQNEMGDRIHDIFIGLMASFQRRMVRFWLRWNCVYRLTSAYRTEMELLAEGYEFLRKIMNNKDLEVRLNFQLGRDILLENKKSNTLNWILKCFWLRRQTKYTNENIFDQIVTLFVGGTDTSAVTIVSTLIMLAMYPDQQELVVDELKSIFDSVDSPVMYDDLSKMVYTEMVIKETLRHFSVGPYIGRKATANVLLKNGVIPKDSIILINAQKLHKNPRIWGAKVNEFYPNHFLPENFTKLHPYSYIAFSGGQRNCVGMRYAWVTVKIILAHLLRRYKFTTDLKYEDIRTKIYMILKIANENAVKFEPRIF